MPILFGASFGHFVQQDRFECGICVEVHGEGCISNLFGERVSNSVLLQFEEAIHSA